MKSSPCYLKVPFHLKESRNFSTCLHKKCFTKGDQRNERKQKCECDDLKGSLIDKNSAFTLTWRNTCRISVGISSFVWVKVLKKKNPAQNAWEKVAECLDFAGTGNFIWASSIWEYFEESCSGKITALFCVQHSYKILASQFDFCRCYFGFR